MASDQILCLVFISTFVLANGFKLDDLRTKRQTMELEDCSRPPSNGHIKLCCNLPKERIWGDLKGSFRKCFNIAKMEKRLMNPGIAEDVDRKATTAATVQGDNNTEANGAFVLRTHPSPERRRFHFSETATDVFTSMYKVIKDTFDVLKDSVVMLTDHFHHRRNDQCVMECVFQDQGFLSDKLVSKEALLGRLHATLGRNEMWHSVAVQAVEMCLQGNLGIPSNSTCQSGSEEIFRCVFKHLFFHCPSWPENNEYCKAVREFYQRCPSGPPPPLEDNHTTTTPEPEDVEEPEESITEEDSITEVSTPPPV